jgi:hypothetical protein
MGRQTKSSLLVSITLFFTLAAWSVSSPIGSGVDTDFHLGSIWCAHGEIQGVCESIDTTNWPTANVTATVPFMFQMCDQRNIYVWPKCELSENNPATQEIRIAPQGKQSIYYWTTHFLASPNVNRSVILIRLFNAIIASLVFFAMLALSSDRLRKAVVISWTLTLIPNGIQLLTGVNARSWAVLGIMSSWVFLQAFLTEDGPNRRKRLWQMACFIGSVAITASARFDALLFVIFTCTVVLGAHFIDFNKLSFKRAAQLVGILIAVLFTIKLVPRLNDIFSFRVPEPFNSTQYFVFQLVHIPEFVADWWGYQIGQQGNGPGIIGLSGTILFAIYMYAALRGSNRKQLFVTIAISLFICLALFRATTAVLSIIPLSGIYTFGLSAPLIGLTLMFSQGDDRQILKKGLAVTTIVVVSIMHALAFYHWIEFFTQRGLNTGFYYKFSLNGTWWWDTWVSPNFVFLGGAALFPIFLTYAWRTSSLELPE